MYNTLIVTRFGKTNNNAIEHVFMYKLIKINISIKLMEMLILISLYMKTCSIASCSFPLQRYG